jgi:hypothetical protein
MSKSQKQPPQLPKKLKKYRIYGIFNNKNNKLLFVHLDKEQVDLEYNLGDYDETVYKQISFIVTFD